MIVNDAGDITDAIMYSLTELWRSCRYCHPGADPKERGVTGKSFDMDGRIRKRNRVECVLFSGFRFYDPEIGDVDDY
jgi:hypothetical protein